MKKTALIVVCSGLAMFGCRKGKQAVESPDSTGESTETQAGETAPEPIAVKSAQGEIKALLLALHRVHFGFDTDTLTDAAKTALNEAAEKLAALPDVALYVDGHTDDRGTTEYNMSLGERRAQTVTAYLSRLGIESERLRIVAFGEEAPMVSGSSDRDHARNRRVEFRILQGDVEFVLEDGELVDDSGRPL